MIHIDNDTLILVLSDVHLGDIYCRRDDFLSFLSFIHESRVSGNLQHLRALVILGDFFDLIWSTIENLSNNKDFNKIYNILQAIRNNSVEIVIALGNHEIPTGGFYNLEFEERKMLFLEKLRLNGFYYNFLNEFTVCQYVILGQNSSNKTVISLFDSIHDIEFNGFGLILREDDKRTIILEHIKLMNKYQYFMTHGYQFEGWFKHHIFLAPVWESFVEENIERVLLNELWYELKQLNLLITDENIEHVASERNLDISDFSSSRIERDLIKIDKKLAYNGRNVKNNIYFRRILQFLKKYSLQPITHVIFGHSHEIGMSNVNNIIMMNAGCWVADKTPSYIEIHNYGDFRVKQF
ncbi:MAG: metallophosphoesterase [Candidatus Lokiarchaeota archaeon]|nr:metallophosphoesterase [Candidatus Lokiarchaeota archaeon]